MTSEQQPSRHTTGAGRPHRRDRGAMAIMIALSTLLLAGFAAIVVDVGALYEERRDLQNGADAAALAVAQSCALGEISCPSAAAAQPIAEWYASANANDGAASVPTADISFDDNEVTVRARTSDAGPNTDGDAGTVDHFFARVFGLEGSPVSATASARWGAPGTVTAIPIIISACEWSGATSNGATFGQYRIIYLHGSASSPPLCSFGPGQDIDGDGDRAEGGFGYLDSSNCSVTISANGNVRGRPGAPNPGALGCSIGDIADQTLLIPIFDDIYSSGTPCGAPRGQNCYHVYGFAAFHVEDVDLNGQWANQGNICSSQRRCLGGQFVRYVSLEEGLEILGEGTAPELGVYSVVLSG